MLPGHAVAFAPPHVALVPSQVPAVVSTPFAHAFAPQLVPAPFTAHAPAVHVEHAPFVHAPCGSAAPSGTAVQMPGEPDKRHDVHAPLHAVAQQTPSARKPLAHWLALVAVVPFGCVVDGGTHLPETHVAAPTQSSALAQVVLQPVSVQPYGEQLVVVDVF
jgi:hypothetical protein